jgi:Gpi18-like mannosyltransferase
MQLSNSVKGQGNSLIKASIAIIAVVCFALYFINYPIGILSKYSETDAIYVLIGSILILASVCAFLIFGEKKQSYIIFAAFAIVTAAAIASRLYFFNEASNDYNVYLSRWLNIMRVLPGTDPLTVPIGDYNMPYLYFLFGVSKLEVFDLYQIKMLSVVFDFVLALGIYKLVSIYTKGAVSKLVAYSLSLFVPTVLLNSAYWGQCDGIYAALCVWGLYFGIKSKGIASISLFALAFSVKIQSIFILPIIFVLVLNKKIKIRELGFFPIVFVATLVPALLCGRSFYDTFSIYISQTSSYPYLTLNCPTFWALFPEGYFEVFGTSALYLAGAVLLVFCVYIYQNKEKLNNLLLFDIAFIFVIMLPFILPRMHERYFYLAEIMCVAYILLHRNRIIIPPLIILTSYFCYYAYLFGDRFITLEKSAIINLVVLVYLCKKLYDDFNEIKLPKKECL